MHAPQTHLKGSFVLLFVDIIFILHAAKQQIQIILLQDGRTSFEGRTLQEDGPLLADMVSG